MMPLADGDAAAREATVSISMLERATERRRNRARLRPDLHHAPFVVVSHHHPARVARQALRRFCGNAVATLEDAIARLIGIRQDRRIDVHHHLIALARRAGIDAVMQRRLAVSASRASASACRCARLGRSVDVEAPPPVAASFRSR